MTKFKRPAIINVAQFITLRVKQSGKTQRQIAEECGFENPNMVTMIKTGATKIPLNRLGFLANALEIDRAHLLRLALAEYIPETWQIIEEIMKGTVLTENELELLQMFRVKTDDSNPKVYSLAFNSSQVLDMVVEVAE